MTAVAVPVIALMAFVIIFALLYGQRVGESMVENADRRVLHHQMLLLGSVAVAIGWLALWLNSGRVIASFSPGWWEALLLFCSFGVVPFSAVYSFEWMADKNMPFQFWSWFIGSFIIVIPVIGQVAVAAIIFTCISELIHDRETLREMEVSK